MMMSVNFPRTKIFISTTKTKSYISDLSWYCCKYILSDTNMWMKENHDYLNGYLWVKHMNDAINCFWFTSISIYASASYIKYEALNMCILIYQDTKILLLNNSGKNILICLKNTISETMTKLRKTNYVFFFSFFFYVCHMLRFSLSRRTNYKNSIFY